MTSVIASRSQWMEAFSRRLFTVADLAAFPAAWTRLLEDPAERLESRLLLMTSEERPAEETSVESQLAPDPLGSSSSTARHPRAAEDFAPVAGRAAARSLSAGSVSRRVSAAFQPHGEAGAEGFAGAFRGLPNAAAVYPGRRASPIGNASERGSESGSGTASPHNDEILSDRVLRRHVSEDGSGGAAEGARPLEAQRSAKEEEEEELRAPGAAAVQMLTPASPAGSPQRKPVPGAAAGHTRLVRGAGGLAGLLGAHTKEQSAPAEVPPAPRTSAEQQISGGSAGQTAIYREAVSGEPRSVPLEDARPSAGAGPPTIDDVLAELYERIHLEYLRTYGASGD